MSHWKYHKKNCPELEKVVLELDGLVAVEPRDEGVVTQLIRRRRYLLSSRNGKVGLHNLGNSCYMNSSLQCLSHIRPLTLYFLSKRYTKDLNTASRDGTKGVLANQYYKLLCDLWFDTGAAVSPHPLKQVLGQLNPEYAGLAQQDAHEVIELLLDKLHEDVNRVQVKPYTEKVEGNASDDAKVAREAWLRHALREDSEVKNLFGSLMRSQLNCPDCGKTSVSFEYHNTVQVAIPRSNTVHLTVIFVPELFANFGRVHNAEQLEQYMRVQTFNLDVDRLQTMHFVKQLLRKRIAAPYLDRSDGELLLLQSEPGLDHRTVCSVLVDSSSVGRFSADAIVYAYCPLKECARRLVVMQVRSTTRTHVTSIACFTHFFALQRTVNLNIEAYRAPDVMRVDGESREGELMLQRLVLVPMLVSFEETWNCPRLRISVLQNSCRFLRRDSVVHQQLVRHMLSSDVIALMQMAATLPISVVDYRCQPELNLNYCKILRHSTRVDKTVLEQRLQGLAVMVQSIATFSAQDEEIPADAGKQWLLHVTEMDQNVLLTAFETTLGLPFPVGRTESVGEFLK